MDTLEKSRDLMTAINKTYPKIPPAQREYILGYVQAISDIFPEPEEKNHSGETTAGS